MTEAHLAKVVPGQPLVQGPPGLDRKRSTLSERSAMQSAPLRLGSCGPRPGDRRNRARILDQSRWVDQFDGGPDLFGEVGLGAGVFNPRRAFERDRRTKMNTQIEANDESWAAYEINRRAHYEDGSPEIVDVLTEGVSLGKAPGGEAVRT